MPLVQADIRKSGNVNKFNTKLTGVRLPSNKEKFASLNGTILLFRSNLPFILF